METVDIHLPETATWTIEDVAATCKVSFMTIHRAVKAGQLVSRKVAPRKLRFIPSDVVQWAADRAARKACKR
jgi:predicted DNA-binding transcriptional regulator AlpA